jgi:hypothetical protein
VKVVYSVVQGGFIAEYYIKAGSYEDWNISCMVTFREKSIGNS